MSKTYIITCKIKDIDGTTCKIAFTHEGDLYDHPEPERHPLLKKYVEEKWGEGPIEIISFCQSPADGHPYCIW